jgi:homoserine O-acetyltransferase
MNKQVYQIHDTLQLECGSALKGVEISYCTFGKLNSQKDNVIWVCHALTANANCLEWWDSLMGQGKLINPDKYFIVCANILGSCYGSTGPLSVNPETKKKYYRSFPLITIRDMAQAHKLLRKHLGIESIALGIGGSMGAYQLMEWELLEPGLFKKHVWMVTSSKESAWGIAVHTTQRAAIEADQSFGEESDNAGAKGLKVARGIGMLTYRNYEAFVKTQTDDDSNKLENFKASSYIHHQGNKLAARFNAYSYHTLTKSMDSHNLSRGRTAMENVLQLITAKVMLIGISSDILCPVSELVFMQKHISNSQLHVIDSPYGHDGFLVEGEKIAKVIMPFIQN